MLWPSLHNSDDFVSPRADTFLARLYNTAFLYQCYKADGETLSKGRPFNTIQFEEDIITYIVDLLIC